MLLELAAVVFIALLATALGNELVRVVVFSTDAVVAVFMFTDELAISKYMVALMPLIQIITAQIKKRSDIYSFSITRLSTDRIHDSCIAYKRFVIFC